MPKKKNHDLKYAILDVVVEFYDKYIKPDTREMIEEVVEEKLEEKLGPIKVAIISLEKNVSVALGDYQGQQMQVSDHEKRITHLETKVPHP